jgi:hypothetical protein
MYTSQKLGFFSEKNSETNVLHMGYAKVLPMTFSYFLRGKSKNKSEPLIYIKETIFMF